MSDQENVNRGGMTISLPILHPDFSPRSVRRPFFWLRRLGVAGLIFFLVKGLLWLIVPVLVAHGLLGS